MVHLHGPTDAQHRATIVQHRATIAQHQATVAQFCNPNCMTSLLIPVNLPITIVANIYDGSLLLLIDVATNSRYY